MATLLHLLHIAGTLLAAVAVLALLAPDRSRVRVQTLRSAAARGGLRVLAEQAAASQLQHGDARSVQALRADRRLRFLIWAGCLAAAIVHAFVCPAHFGEATRVGLFFLALSAAQLALVVLVLRDESGRAVRCAVAVNAATMLLWIVTRTSGLPFGLSEPESVGLPDLAATAAELLAATAGGLLILRLRASAASPNQRRPVPAR